MSWQLPISTERQSLPVSATVLEERINMYISAMDKAGAMNNSQQSSQLQRDVQLLVDLMEKVSSGQVVLENEVPPPLDITPQNDILANPLGELSSRMSEYHKALYFAEEELSDNRTNKIKDLQKELQLMHNLQKRAQDGFPIRADEIPPPVVIPSDTEFDNDALNTITTRISQYRTALTSAQEGKECDRRRIPKIESALRTLEFLLTRARAKRPVWKRDIPQEYEYFDVGPIEESEKNVNRAKLTLEVRSLHVSCANLVVKVKDEEREQQRQVLLNKLKAMESALSTNPPQKELKKINSTLHQIKMDVSSLEKYIEGSTANFSKDTSLKSRAEDLALLDTRINEYTSAALSAKRENQVTHAIKHLKVLKGLQSLKEQLKKGNNVDMTLVPPPPPVFTPVKESPQSSLSSSRESLEDSTSNGAIASVGPVSFGSRVSSAEDKLAKQLTSYLSDTNVDIPHSGPSSLGQATSQTNHLPEATHLSSTATHLSATGFDNSKVTQLGSEGVDQLACKEKGQQRILADNNNSKELKMGNISQEEHESLSNSHLLSSNQEQNLPADKLESSSEGHNIPKNNSSGNQVEDSGKNRCANEEKTPQSSPNKSLSSSPQKASDIYNRKTLDNVGFLSCQNVPAQSTQTLSDQMSMLSNVGFSESTDYTENDTHGEHGNKTLLDSQAVFSQHNVEVKADNSVEMRRSNRDYKVYDKQEISKEGTANLQNSSTQSLEKESGLQNNILLSDEPCLSDNVSTLKSSYQSKSDGFSSLPVIPSANNTHAPVDSPPDSLPNICYSENNEDRLMQPKSLSNSSTNNDDRLIPRESDQLPSCLVPTLSDVQVIQSDRPPDNMLNTGASDLAQVKNDDSELEDLMESMSFQPFTNNSGLSVKSVSSGQHSLFTSTNALNGDDYTGSGTTTNTTLLNTGTFQHDKGEITSLHSTRLKSNQEHLSLISKQLPSETKIKFTGNLSQQPSLSSVEPILTPNNDVNSMSLPANKPSLKYKVQSSNCMDIKGLSQQATDHEVTLRCLENLKYDYLLAEAKSLTGEAEDFKSHMEKIKTKLRHGGRQTWDVYKNCVQSELTWTEKKIEEMRQGQLWDDLQIFSQKKILAERELAVLRVRLHDLKY